MMNSGYARVAAFEDTGDATQQQQQLQQGLVGPAAGQILPTATSVPMMQVVAPATLPEGYEFTAAIGDRMVKVVVPPGGVEEGQKFEAPFPEHLTTVMTGVSVPVGHWRDGLFQLFRYGVCHPHCWTACCCHLLAAGQVISRLKLTWYGRPGTTGQAAVAFKIIFATVFVYFTIYTFLNFLVVYVDPNSSLPPGAPRVDPGPTFLMVAWIHDLFHWIYWITTTIVLTNLRQYVRSKYAIPAPEHEDCCCSCWCPCFVAGQMLRHTTDYDVYPATCCTETGIPPHVPSIV